VTRPTRRQGHTHWSPAEMDRLERAIVEGARVQLSRRGTVYMVVPREIRPRGPSEFLIGTTNAGDTLAFALDEIEYFDVLT
jgi:hypothetical protein